MYWFTRVRFSPRASCPTNQPTSQVKRKENDEEDSRDRGIRCDISFSFFSRSFSFQLCSLSFLKVFPMSRICYPSSKDYNFKTIFIPRFIFSQSAHLCSFISTHPLFTSCDAHSLTVCIYLMNSNERKRSLVTDFIEIVF